MQSERWSASLPLSSSHLPGLIKSVMVRGSASAQGSPCCLLFSRLKLMEGHSVSDCLKCREILRAWSAGQHRMDRKGGRGTEDPRKDSVLLYPHLLPLLGIELRMKNIRTIRGRGRKEIVGLQNVPHPVAPPAERRLLTAAARPPSVPSQPARPCVSRLLPPPRAALRALCALTSPPCSGQPGTPRFLFPNQNLQSLTLFICDLSKVTHSTVEKLAAF